MNERSRGDYSAPHTPTRQQFLKAGAMAGAGLAFAGADPLYALASAPGATAACTESARDILNTALIAEQLATTMYYTGLTSPAVLHSGKIAGSSGDPNAVAANGNPQNVAYLQAALDQEQKHARMLTKLGATSPYTSFYFPQTTFESVGYTSREGTFLWVLDRLETAFISAYIAAVKRLGALGQVDAAILMVRILGVECQHRTLFRVISADDPADNVTLEVAEFNCVGDAATALQPYLTGHGFPHGATPAISLPSPALTAAVIGKNSSS